MRYATFFLSIFLITLVTASPNLNFQHEEIQPGETILGTITTSGEFLAQIQSSDIKFYEGRKKVYFEFDITFHNNTHYLYIYANREGNFSIEINNILYKKSGTTQSATIIKEFNINQNILVNPETNETYTKILSIKPGFISTILIPKIKLINTGTSTLNLTYNQNETSILPGATKQIEFTPEGTFSYFEVSSYKNFAVPIIRYYTTPIDNQTNQTDTNQTNQTRISEPGLKQNSNLSKMEIFTNNKTNKSIELSNIAEENITNIQAKTDIEFLKIDQILDMSAKTNQTTILSFNPEFEGVFEGTINLTYKQNESEYTLSIPITIFVLKQGSLIEEFQIIEQTCAEKSGIVCNKDTEFCNSTILFTRKNETLSEACCLTSCIAKSNNSSGGTSYGWVIALIIFAVLGAGGYYLYNKQKKLTPTKPTDQIKETTEKFENRLKGITSNRITGGLTKS